MSWRESLSLQGMAFCPFMEDFILIGRDRDLIIYDRLLKAETLVIPNASFTGLWKDIVQVNRPDT